MNPNDNLKEIHEIEKQQIFTIFLAIIWVITILSTRATIFQSTNTSKFKKLVEKELIAIASTAVASKKTDHELLAGVDHLVSITSVTNNVGYRSFEGRGIFE
jgi:hypothetical protein